MRDIDDPFIWLFLRNEGLKYTSVSKCPNQSREQRERLEASEGKRYIKRFHINVPLNTRKNTSHTNVNQV